MKRVLKITLKSDLCAGSGYSYAGIIDSDACFDRYGIPYIPARRIKGCLREAAGMIGADKAIFGDWGQRSMDQKNVFHISDALPKEYMETVQALDNLKDSAKLAKYFSAEQIRQYYSRVKAQTRIDENGVADNNSLRFTRIVNQYCPSDKQEMCFYADVELADGDEETEKTLKRAAKALRHMGENRNRGLGNVKCDLLTEEEAGVSSTDGALQIKNEEMVSKAQQSEGFSLKYTIRTEAPVVISSESSDDSETYISGTSVMGAFAAAYLRRPNRTADDTFEEMFLKNRMCFSPLYPSDEKGNVYVPAPSYIGKLKKSGALVNVSMDKFPEKEDEQYGAQIENGKYYPGDGNQPKKLKGKYVGFLNSGIAVKEVETEMIYHHRHKTQDTEEQLYVLQAIQPGQYFSGTISGGKEQILEVLETLKENALRFGKSRNAQYGTCRVVNAEILESEADGTNPAVGETYQPGESLLVTFRTDGIFLDPKNGNTTVRLEEVRNQIKDALEKFISRNPGQENAGARLAEVDEQLYAELEVGMLSGFYGVWNLRRESVPCVRVGSTIEFRVADGFVMPGGRLQAGCRKTEGFGILDVRKRPDGWLLNGKENETGNVPENMGVSEDGQTNIPEVLQPIFWENLKKVLFREMEERALRVSDNGLTASAVGRATLMFTESVNEYEEKHRADKEKRNPDRADEIFEKLKGRVDSMKDEEKKKKLNSFIKKYYTNEEQNTSVQKLLNLISDTSARKEIAGECKLYCLQQALVVLKYKMKDKKGEGED